MRVRRLRRPGLLLATLLGATLGYASACAWADDKPTPVLFVPLKVSAPFAKQEKLLRTALTARMLATGAVTAAVSAETEAAVQECVRGVNRDANAQQCWVRIGQGQGALMMVSAEVDGTERSCTVSGQLTVLETRVSPRMHLQILEPCGRDELLAEMGRAARALAGQPAAGRTARAVGPPILTVPPPPPTTTAPGPAGRQPPPPANAVASLSVTGSPRGARVDISGPPTFNGGKPLATSLPLFPPQTVPAGEYRVKVSAPDHTPYDERRLVAALGTWTVEVALRPSTATLLLSGEPAGAETRVRCGPDFATRPRNVTQEPFGLPAEPLEFIVPAGRCRVDATFVGWQDARHELDLAGGERRTVRLKLQQRAAKPPGDPAAVWRQPGTGLVWARADNGATVTWHKAKAYCEQATTGGFDDWRLPEMAELAKLGDPSRSSPCGGLTCRVAAPLTLSNHWIWSRSMKAEGGAWIHNFLNNTRGHNTLDDTVGPHHALCVRDDSHPAAAPPAASPSSGVGVWTQPRTGRTWTVRDNGADVTGHQARAYCAGLRAGGFSDWELPSVDDFKPLYDAARTVACGDRTCHVVPAVSLSNNWMWTRTPLPAAADKAYIYNFSSGTRGSNDLSDTSDPHRVICVRRR